MKAILSLICILTPLAILSQKRDSMFRANKEATLQLLHIMDEEIDSTIKVLYIDGDIAAHSAFWDYAQSKNIPFVLIKRTVAEKDEAAFDSIKNITLPCLEIEVSSKHNTFVVCFSDITHDPDNFSFHLSLSQEDKPCQTWTWDKKTNALVKNENE